MADLKPKKEALKFKKPYEMGVKDEKATGETKRFAVGDDVPEGLSEKFLTFLKNGRYI